MPGMTYHNWRRSESSHEYICGKPTMRRDVDGCPGCGARVTDDEFARGVRITPGIKADTILDGVMANR